MANCSGNCESCESKCEKADFMAKLNEKSRVNKVIAVMSGKGGVGKSFVTASCAVAMQKAGFRCAVLDADVTGPSIPKLFGKHCRAVGDESGIDAVVSESGIQLMSMNFMLENENDPVVWRGPIVSGVIKQFWTDVVWRDVDYMFVDMPPGTADAPLTVFQSLPINAIITVSTPQDLVKMIVEKSVKMSQMMKIPLLGIVENMSYFECPNCHEKHQIFGESHIDEIAAEFGVSVLAKLPLRAENAKNCDEGKIEQCDVSAFAKITDALKKL